VTAAAGALVAALMRDPRVASCASESGKTSTRYITEAFERREITLRDGSRMTVVVATDPCLTRGAATKIAIFEQTGGAYRRVLDDVTLPGLFQVNRDGTVMLPTHESMETIFESEYVWNGTSYVFSPSRSNVYDVGLGIRRPYRLAVRFSPGAFSATLTGSVALNFGQEYVFDARAGQLVTIELTRSSARPSISLWSGDNELTLTGSTRDRWSAKLPKTGAYELIVSGTNESDETRLSRYTIRLSVTPGALSCDGELRRNRANGGIDDGGNSLGIGLQRRARAGEVGAEVRFP
jgi:hypothetical protein